MRILRAGRAGAVVGVSVSDLEGELEVGVGGESGRVKDGLVGVVG